MKPRHPSLFLSIFILFLLVVCIPCQMAQAAGPTIQPDCTSTQVTLKSDLNPSHPGQTVTITATVSAGNYGTPTGKLRFSIDGVAQPNTITLLNGKATYTTSILTVGEHIITASYLGNSSYAASVSTPLPQTVIFYAIFLPQITNQP